MKSLGYLLLLLMPFRLSAQHETDSLRTYISSLLEKNHAGTITPDEATDLRIYAHSNENKGIELFRNGNDEDAIDAFEKAIVIWTAIRETGNEANSRTYIGILLGRKGAYDSSRAELLKAAELFTGLKMDTEIALCRHELSIVLGKAGEIDSALWYEQEALAYRLKVNAVPDIVSSNNQLIHLYRILRRYDAAAKHQLANEKLMSVGLDWNPIINFYYVSHALYRDSGEKDKAAAYLTLYRNWISKLKEEGIEARSMYDGS